MNTRRPRTKLEIQIGQRFGRYSILNEDERHVKPSGAPIRMFKCICDCGTVKTVRLSSLTEGTTVSCGCFHKENAASVIGGTAKTHGKSKTNFYMVWIAMKARCINQKDKSYPRYGGRGIRVCDEWIDNFEAFAEYLGDRPNGMTVDRIDSNGNYEPGNVRWATYTEQARNTRRNIHVIADGRSMTLAEACSLLSIPYEKTRHSLRGDMSFANSKGVANV